MDINNYIYQAIFEEKPRHKVFYELIWEQFKEDGFVNVEDAGTEIDTVFKATALTNLLSEFVYRMYDEFNETGAENVVEYLGNLGIYDDEILAFCEELDMVECFDDNTELTIKNTLDYYSEIVADKMLEDFECEDIFNYIFTATYDFQQDFVFDFEDSEELVAFVEANSYKLDEYKEEYPAVMSWIENGMFC